MILGGSMEQDRTLTFLEQIQIKWSCCFELSYVHRENKKKSSWNIIWIQLKEDSGVSNFHEGSYNIPIHQI